MKLIFSHTISKKEKISIQDRTDIIKASSKRIFINIKGNSLPKHSQLVKIYMTTIAGARRAIFLVDLESGDRFFLFYRSKNDKIGKNITIKNPEFKITLIKYLSFLNDDICKKAYDAFELKLLF